MNKDTAKREAVPSLVYPGNDGKVAVFALPNGSTTIGRARDNDIHLIDEKVAEHHAIVTRDGSALILRDLLSGGRTFVNDAAVKESELRHGDVLRVGDTRLRIAYVAPSTTGRIAARPDAPGLPSGTPAPGALSRPASEVRAALGAAPAPAADTAALKQLREREAKRQKGLARARQLSDEVNSADDLEVLLEKCAVALLEIFDAERAVCLLLEEDGINPLLTVERRKEGSEEGSGVAREIIDRCLKARAVVKIASPAIAGKAAGGDARGFAAPLFVDGKALGLLLHERAIDAPSLEVEDLHLTAMLTNHLSLAVAKLLSS